MNHTILFSGDVVITDLAEFVPLLQLNIDENKSLIQGSACAQTLVWGQSINKELANPDLILLADCVYYEEVWRLEIYERYFFSLAIPTVNGSSF